MIRAAIFDLDGVVLFPDSDRVAEVRARWEQSLGSPWDAIESQLFGSPLDEAALIGAVTVAEYWQCAARRLGVSTVLLGELVDAFLGSGVVDTELTAFIEGLRPRMTTALLTNSWADRHRELDHLGIKHLFDAVIISAEEGVAKPGHEIYKRALTRLGVEPHEAVFVDDRPENVEAARELGIHALHRTPTSELLDDLRAVLAPSP